MNTGINQGDAGRWRRWLVYLLLIGLSSASATYRILHVNALDANHRIEQDVKGWPLLCANDKSRWCTIRSLGDHGCYEIDKIIADPKSGEFSFDRQLYDRNWQTIDLVRHRDVDGEMHYYSSKPTLFPTLLAYVYRAVKLTTGLNLVDHTFEVVWIMLILVNVIPLGIALILLAATLEMLSDNTFTKMVLVTGASFGTFLTPFVVTLNNHLPAAVSVAIALFFLFLIFRNPSGMLAPYFFAGLFAAFAAANELPALAFFCCAALLLLVRGPIQTLILFVPGAALVAGGFFLTNYQAHNDWIPPYAHRSDGAIVTTIDNQFFDEIQQGIISENLAEEVNRHVEKTGFFLSEKTATVELGQMPVPETVESRYILTQTDDSQRLAIVKNKKGDIEVRLWNNWYDYPESRWLLPKKGGIDRGEADPEVYALHCLVGHHGVFSLTPLWLLSLLGMPLMFRKSWRQYYGIVLMMILVSIVVVAFYLTRPLEDRNYGGGTSALRWLLWLAPFWIISAIPFVELISRSIWGKIIVVILLVVSMASAHYSAMNPWVHPWLYELMVEMEWIQPFTENESSRGREFIRWLLKLFVGEK